MSELAAGSPAPAFTLPRLSGGVVEFPPTSCAGAPPLSLLVFFKSSCPTCRWALPFFERLHRGAGGSLRVLGVAEDEADDALAFAAALSLTFPIALESEPWPVSAAYGLTTVPTAFLVDAAGTIARISAGFSRDDLLEIAALAAQSTGALPASPFPEGADVPAFRPG